MKIKLRNIGIIKKADISIDGITVIGGENNTGKSTISKSLFLAFNGLHNLDEQVFLEKRSSVCSIIQGYFNNALPDCYINISDEESLEDVIRFPTKYIDDRRKLYSALKSMIVLNDYSLSDVDDNEEKDIDDMNNGFPSEQEFSETLDKIINILNVDKDTVIRKIVWQAAKSEFNGQITNVDSDEDGYIGIVIKGKECGICFDGSDDDRVKKINDIISISENAVYFDDPYLIDRLYSAYRFRRRLSGYSYNHQEILSNSLISRGRGTLIEGIIADNTLQTIEQILNGVIPGRFGVGENRKYTYQEKGKKAVNISNLSSGMKTYLLIKVLLQNGAIRQNGTMILDEPEVHLHPEWQIKLAQIVVLLHQEFGVHILLNTHSPYFLEAVEKYSMKYGAINKCRFYLAENVDGEVKFLEVTGHTDSIYKKLAEPFQKLEDISLEVDD